MTWPIEAVRQQFPILQQKVGKYPLAYLDNAATAQKPQSVIDTEHEYYTSMNANVHRGVHHLSEVASEAYEQARVAVQGFIGAAHAHEVIFTKGTTEGINLVAYSYGLTHLQSGDEILISRMEHHANIVPWQQLCQQTGAVLRIVELDAAGNLDMQHWQSLLSDKTKLVAITHASNVLGTVTPIHTITEQAHAVGAVVLVDAAQSVVHGMVDVRAMDCDFLVFGLHKMYGPTGVGVLYGKTELLESMQPYQTGGNMIEHVTMEATTFAGLPAKFEAGTPNIAGIVASHAAVTYMQNLDWAALRAYEAELYAYTHSQLSAIDGLKLLAQPDEALPIFSFVIEGAHANDVAHIINQYGVAVRSGHHCAMPLMATLGVQATVRASLALYNNKEEVDQLLKALHQAIAMLA